MQETEKETIILARYGQGRFRKALFEIEHECRISHIDKPNYLIASHIKPWRHSTNDERIDGENGLVLCPNAGLLFDKGFILFKANGDMIVSENVHRPTLGKMHIPAGRLNIGRFTKKQQEYLEFHRDRILLGVTRNEEANY